MTNKDKTGQLASVIATAPVPVDVGGQVAYLETERTTNSYDGKLALLDETAQRPLGDAQKLRGLFRRQKTGRLCLIGLRHDPLPNVSINLLVACGSDCASSRAAWRASKRARDFNGSAVAPPGGA
jgi:hypothetical protein